MYVRALHTQTAGTGAPDPSTAWMHSRPRNRLFVLGRDADLDAKFLFFILNATVIILPATWAQSLRGTPG